MDDTDGKWKNTALLVIDMQKDFVLPDSPVHVKGGQAIVPNIIKAVEVARGRGIPIIWFQILKPCLFIWVSGVGRGENSKDLLIIINITIAKLPIRFDEAYRVVREHDPLGRDVELFRRHLFSPGKPIPTSKGSVGAELVDGLVIKEDDYKLVKMRFSAFFQTHLHLYLQGAGICHLVITGVQTPNCIRQTVFDAVALDYQSVTVILDATAAATDEIHAANILDMKNIGVATPTLSEWSELVA